MKKSLVQKVAPWIFAGVSLIVSGCGAQYNEIINIKDSKISYCSVGLLSTDYDIKEEKKDKTIIEYNIKPDLRYDPPAVRLVDLRINGISCDPLIDTTNLSVFNKAEKRANFLVNLRDTIGQTNRLKVFD